MPRMPHANKMVLKSARVSARVDSEKRAWLENQALSFGSINAVLNNLIEKEMEKKHGK